MNGKLVLRVVILTALRDINNWGPTGGFGVHVRKALGYVFSLRAEYDWIRLRGLNYQPTQAYGKNAVLIILLRECVAAECALYL